MHFMDEKSDARKGRTRSEVRPVHDTSRLVWPQVPKKVLGVSGAMTCPEALESKPRGWMDTLIPQSDSVLSICISGSNQG